MTKKQNMKILITGGAGFIGSHLSRSFSKKGDEVTVIDNLITGDKKNIDDLLSNKAFRFYKEDLLTFDFSKLSCFDLVYDLASPASPAVFEKMALEILKVNSLGLFRLLDFFIGSKSKKMVFASTSEVYGDPLKHPQKETYFGNVNSFGPRSCYDEGKRFAEAIIYSYIKKYNSDIRIARIFNTYGPFMNKADGRVISNFINQALDNRPLTVYGDGSQTRSCCYITDMIDGLSALGTLDGIEGEVVNIGNPEERSVLEIAELIKNMTKSNSEIKFMSIGRDDPKKRRPDISKAKKILGWEPKIPLGKGLEKTIEYFKNI
ncbi:MAG: NAD-dependent epimerase/dehydratase [Candidatus Roizmanbacteria bacterium GW2011_GWA2_35_8]|uniref:UDP-glucuronate decarboxylase n=1 Tax=Candidatus Roizmanbacteria bacterium GW2011_GWA2_35_8 TaxID=1618479 RepID=A0A0G0G3L3_9BACT|nr:MAG: NAD-dependent epimerase/dehydratase [Candidatus Roizmanbacteria bacterium GW2011_GWA2_35_8]